MSYTKTTLGPRGRNVALSGARRPGEWHLAGVSSQPPGRRVSRRALVPMSGVSSQPPGRRVSRRALTGMSGLPVANHCFGTLGDATLVDPTTLYQQRSIQLQEQLLAAQQHWAEGDKNQKWIAIAATVMIPVTAAIWRALGVGRRRKP